MIDLQTQRDIARRSFLKTSDFYRVSSPLFSTLARSCVSDDQLADLVSATRPGQSAGILLMCVVHYLLLKSPDAELAAFFPSLSDRARPASEAFPTFREFCLDHSREIRELLSWRTVNTNLAEKATCLLPAIQHVADITGEPITLLEICCSSGLNMLFDQYHYDYGDFGEVGPKESPIQLQCKVVGDGRPPVGSVPIVARRLGVDLVTVDVSDPLERLWMEAVLAPEWRSERARLRMALKLRQQTDLQIFKGDALDVLPSLLDELQGPLCILQSYCIGHWSLPARAALDDLLSRSSRHRDLHRLSIEGPESDLPSVARKRMLRLAAAGVSIFEKSSPSTIDHILYSKGNMTTRLLGEGSIFGTWLDWQV